MKTQTRILDNILYYTRNIELHRKGKKSRTVRITPILICSICCSPHLTGKCGTRVFLRWGRAQGQSPHAPGIPKNAYGPVNIPLIRGATVARRWAPPSEGGKSLGERPPRLKEISRYRVTLRQIRDADNTASWSATRQLERFGPILICGILWPPHLTGMCSTRPFLWVRVQGCSPHEPGISKNAYGPVVIPLIRSASAAGRWSPQKGVKS